MQDSLVLQEKSQYIESLEFSLDSTCENNLFIEDTETFFKKLFDCSFIGTLKLGLLENLPKKSLERLFLLLQEKSIDNLNLYLNPNETLLYFCKLLEKNTAIKRITLKQLKNDFSAKHLKEIVKSYQQNPVTFLELQIYPETEKDELRDELLEELKQHCSNNFHANNILKKMQDFHQAILTFKDLANLLECQAHVHYADAKFLSPIYRALELICHEFAKYSDYRSIYNIRNESNLAGIIQAKDVILVDQGPDFSLLEKYQLIILRTASIYLPAIPQLMQDREVILDRAMGFIFTGNDNLKDYFFSSTNADIAITCQEVREIAEAVLSQQNENNSNNNEDSPKPDSKELEIINEALAALTTQGYTIEWFNLLVHCTSIREEINKRYRTHRVVSLEEVFLGGTQSGSLLGTKYHDKIDFQILYNSFKNGSRKIDIESFEKTKWSLNHFIEGYYSTPHGRILIADQTKKKEEKVDAIRGLEKAVANACPYALEFYSSSGISDDSDVENYHQQSFFYHGYYATSEVEKILNIHKNIVLISSTLKDLDKAIEDKNYQSVPRFTQTMVYAISGIQEFLKTSQLEQAGNLQKKISSIKEVLEGHNRKCIINAMVQNLNSLGETYAEIKSNNHQILLFLRDFEKNMKLENQALQVLNGLNQAAAGRNYHAALYLSNFYGDINPQEAIRFHKLAYEFCDLEKVIFNLHETLNNNLGTVHQKRAAIAYLEEKLEALPSSQQPEIITLLHKTYYSLLTYKRQGYYLSQLDITGLEKWLEFYQKHPCKMESDLLIHFLVDYAEKHSSNLRSDPKCILLFHKTYDISAKIKKTKDIEEKWFDFFVNFRSPKEGAVLLVSYYIHTAKNLNQACEVVIQYCDNKPDESLEDFYKLIFDNIPENSVDLTSWQEARIKFNLYWANRCISNNNSEKAKDLLVQATQMGDETALESIADMYSKEAKEYPSRYLDLAIFYQDFSNVPGKDKTYYLKEAYRYYLLAAQFGLDHAVCEIDRFVINDTLPKELVSLYEETIWKLILKNIEDKTTIIKFVQQATAISKNPVFACLQQTLHSSVKLNHFDEYWDISRLPLENLRHLFFQYDKDYLFFSNLHHKSLANTIYQNLSQLKLGCAKKELSACLDVPDLIKNLEIADQSGRMVTMLAYALRSIVNPPVPQPEAKIRPSIVSSRY